MSRPFTLPMNLEIISNTCRIFDRSSTQQICIICSLMQQPIRPLLEQKNGPAPAHNRPASAIHDWSNQLPIDFISRAFWGSFGSSTLCFPKVLHRFVITYYITYGYIYIYILYIYIYIYIYSDECYTTL